MVVALGPVSFVDEYTYNQVRYSQREPYGVH